MVTVAHLGTKMDKNDTFTIEVKPDGAASLVIERTLPSVIDKVNTLN
jgi:archaellin